MTINTQHTVFRPPSITWSEEQLSFGLHMPWPKEAEQGDWVRLDVEAADGENRSIEAADRSELDHALRSLRAPVLDENATVVAYLMKPTGRR